MLPHSKFESQLQNCPEDVSIEEEKYILLQPVSIQVFDGQDIYSLCKFRPIKRLKLREFLNSYIDDPVKIRVYLENSTAADVGKQKDRVVTAYGFGFDSWYIDVTSDLI